MLFGTFCLLLHRGQVTLIVAEDAPGVRLRCIVHLTFKAGPISLWCLHILRIPAVTLYPDWSCPDDGDPCPLSQRKRFLPTGAQGAMTKEMTPALLEEWMIRPCCGVCMT